jgi:sensor histidine kinase YesM
MKLTTNKYYIIFSFICWILLFFFTLTTLKIHRIFGSEELVISKIKYALAEGLACGILAFILSFITAYFIDHYLDFKKIKRVDILKLITVFVGVQVVYSLLIWPILIYLDSYLGNNAFRETNISLLYIKLYNIPFFATLFFVWLFVYITINIYHQLKNVQLKQIFLENNLKESELNTLKGQINPHFMFNSLNNIRGLILEDTSKSREMITRLAEMLRYSLTKNNVNAITLENEIEMVDNYIAISKIQLEERLQFDKNISLTTSEVLIPPMIIQMLIENAVKHGITNIKNGGVISLNIKKETSNLHIEVINPGKLNNNTSSTQLGVKNIKERLSLLYKGNASFDLEERNNQVIATIKIPLS